MQQKRQRTFESLTALVLALAERQPLLFIVEDLHWIDPSTLEWLTLLLDQTPSSAILLLMTCRPEFEAPWHSRSYLTQVTLDRLETQHSRRMVKSIVRDRDLSAPVIHQIVEHSDGVPLFVEELSRAVLDSGLSDQIPATLQDTLTARLDQVGKAKRTAQLGAVIGRQFEGALLRAVSPLDEAALEQDLHDLTDNELLYQLGVGPDAVYRFKHALIQDAAYTSLLRRTRQQLHGQIAQVLEAQFPDVAETRPELLAHHYTEAGLHQPAINWWQRAGQRAAQRSAHHEAVAHLRKGLELVMLIPKTPERTQQELLYHVVLGDFLGSEQGFAAPEIEKIYTRAQKLCQYLGETPLWIAWGMVAQGWAQTLQGQCEAGIAILLESLEKAFATGSVSFRPHVMALLAEGYGNAGQAEEGLRLLAETQEIIARTGECYYEAEVCRLMGELLVVQSPDYMTETEVLMSRALDIARQQQAKSWELRAATSLARLWQSQGKRQEAHELLTPVYSWFTEGFDTADLKDAKALLNELG